MSTTTTTPRRPTPRDGDISVALEYRRDLEAYADALEASQAALRQAAQTYLAETKTINHTEAQLVAYGQLIAALDTGAGAALLAEIAALRGLLAPLPCGHPRICSMAIEDAGTVCLWCSDCAEADLPLPALHAAVLATVYATDTGDGPHDALGCLLRAYQIASSADVLATLATTCDRQAIRHADTLPVDLIGAYARLARLARWRVVQIEETR